MKHLIVMVLAISVLSGCNSHAYFDEAQILLKDAETVLLKKGICSDQQDCSTRQLVTFEAGGWSFGPWSGGRVHIHVYQINDNSVTQSLHDSFIQRHSDMLDISVYLHVYASKHGDTNVKIAGYVYK